MHILLALRMKYALFTSPFQLKLAKINKKARKPWAGKKETFWGRFLLIFDDFGGPQGRPKMSKNEKNAFRKSVEKKESKKGGDDTSPGRGSAAIARPEGMQDSCSGRFLPWFLTIDLHTPPLLAECGGFFSLARSPPTLGIERFKGILVNHCPLW